MNEYNEGDLVEAVKGEESHKGRVRNVGDLSGAYSDQFLGERGTSISNYMANGFTVAVIEKAAPALPTEPGWYTSADGWIWKLTDGGYWGRMDFDYMEPDKAQKYAPFTRLEPEAVTARRVLEAIETVYGEDYLNNSDDYWNGVAKQFGATK